MPESETTEREMACAWILTELRSTTQYTTDVQHTGMLCRDVRRTCQNTEFWQNEAQG